MKYWGPLKIKFKERFSSRATNLFWVLSKPIGIFVAITVWTTIYNYSGGGVIKGLTLDETINYMIFTIIIGSLTYTNVGHTIGRNINQGWFNTKLVRPVDVGLDELFKTIGGRLHAAIFEIVPGVFIAWLLFGFHQFNPVMTILSLVSISMSLIINFFLSINWSLMYFKTIEYGRMEWIKNMIFRFFAGMYIPLNFLPQVFQGFIKYSPFQFLAYIPARIFINSYQIGETIVFLLIQATWIIFLYAVYKVGWHYGIKNFSGVGA
jgi:ABC-2 type transport system permease protein